MDITRPQSMLDRDWPKRVDRTILVYRLSSGKWAFEGMGAYTAGFDNRDDAYDGAVKWAKDHKHLGEMEITVKKEAR